MKQKEAEKLKPAQTVYHRRYGQCVIREVMISEGELFGIVIRPVNQDGRDLLKQDCGCDIPDMLEDLPRNLKIENPHKGPGEEPIDLGTVWGDSENNLPKPEDKNHFAGNGNRGISE